MRLMQINFDNRENNIIEEARREIETNFKEYQQALKAFRSIDSQKINYNKPEQYIIEEEYKPVKLEVIRTDSF